MTRTTAFAGLTIEGYGTVVRDHGKPQLPREDLEPLFVAALAVSGLTGIRWRQYTPYFNDGEPCYFGANDVFFKFNNTSEDGGDEEDGWLYASDVEISGGAEEKYQQVPNPNYGQGTGYDSRRPTVGKFVKTGKTFPRREGWDALNALSQAIPGGQFDDVLVELFGDHVEVTVTHDGISVDDYDHD